MTVERQSASKIARNIAYSAVAWLVPIALSLFATPVIVSALGVTDYGIYSLIAGFIGYSFTFAIGRAITKYVAEFRANGESSKIREVVSATLIINLVIGGLTVILILFSASWITSDVLLIDAALRERAVIGIHIAAFSIFFTMLGQAFTAAIQGVHRFDVYSRIVNVSSVVLVIGNLVLALQGAGLTLLLAWNLAATVLTTAAYIVAARRLLPEARISFSVGRESWQMVFKFSSGVVGYQILANFILLFERGWITRQLGPEALSYYVVPMTIAIMLHAFVASAMSVIFPLASELERERSRLEIMYLKATKVVAGIVVFMVITLITIRLPFLTAYVGPDFAERSSDLMIFHVLAFGCAAIGIVAWQVAEGLGYTSFHFYSFIVCALLCIPLMVLWIDPWGSFGVAAARLTGFGTVLFSIFVVEKWMLGGIKFRFWIRLVPMLAAAGVVCALLEAWILRNSDGGWFSIILTVAGGVVAYCLSLWLVGFVNSEDRAILMNIVKRRNA